MSRILGVAALAGLILTAHLFAQGTPSGKTGREAKAGQTELQKNVLALESRRIDAMVKHDLKALDELLANDLSYTHSGGSIDTKASFIALIRDRGRYLGVDYSGTEVIPAGPTSVIVRGIATIRLENTAPYDVFFVDVWAQREGAWKMVAWQATRVAPKTS